MAHTQSYPSYSRATQGRKGIGRAFSPSLPILTPSTLAKYIALPIILAAAPSLGSLLGFIVGLCY